MKRGDDEARAAKCIAGTLVLTNIIRQMGDRSTPPPRKPIMNVHPFCLVESEPEDEANENSTYFRVGDREVRFRSARVFVEIPVPQDLDQLNFPFPPTQRIITQESFHVAGQVVSMRRFIATLNGYRTRLDEEIESVNEMQLRRMRRYLQQEMRNTNCPAQIPPGYNRDFLDELFELRRQQLLIEEALRYNKWIPIVYEYKYSTK